MKHREHSTSTPPEVEEAVGREELAGRLPCPWCGRAPSFDHTNPEGVRFSCLECTEQVFEDFEQAAVAWNTRALRSPSPADDPRYIKGWQSDRAAEGWRLNPETGAVEKPAGPADEGLREKVVSAAWEWAVSDLALDPDEHDARALRDRIDLALIAEGGGHG